MNRTAFIQLLQKPHLSGKEQENELREMLYTYPYFQAAQILLAKNLHNQNSYLYEKQLKTAALYAGNRKLLYHFIQKTQEEIVAEEPNVVPSQIVQPEPITIPVSGISSEPLVLADKTTPVIEEVKAPEKIIASEEFTSEIIEETHPPEEISSVTEDGIGDTSPVQPETSLTSFIDNKEEIPVIIRTNEPHSFDEWLKLVSVKHRIEPEIIILPDTQKPVEVHPLVEAETIVKEIIEEPEAAPVNKNKAFDSDSIIEKFIKESPSISRPKAEFFNPANMAKISVEEDDDLATETLAKIYTKQGNYKKAIRIYEKLCLKFPDKMPYFVALIQKIKSDNKID